jgi:hypothetical protein
MEKQPNDAGHVSHCANGCTDDVKDDDDYDYPEIVCTTCKTKYCVRCWGHSVGFLREPGEFPRVRCIKCVPNPKQEFNAAVAPPVLPAAVDTQQH